MKHLHFLTSSLVILLLSIGLLKNSISLMLYQYDTALFVAMFCVNKDKPELKCNGACELGKIQQEQEKKDSQNVLKHISQELVFHQYKPIQVECSVRPRVKGVLKTTSYWENQYDFTWYQKLLEPPRIS